MHNCYTWKREGGICQWGQSRWAPLAAHLVGLSIFERPILDHDAKAHITDFIMDFMKSSGFHEIWQISYGFHEIRWISYGFHEIWRISYGFHEIRWISYGFHHEIQRISWNPWNPADFRWNLVDFTQISPVKSTQNFSKNSSVWWMPGWGSWPRISWNPPDFTLKSGGFHLVKSGRFHLWNPPKIIKASVSAKTFQFDECRVGDFTLEIQWISPWNLVDFTHEIWQLSPRFHLWNPPKIIKASVLAKTLQFDECRGGGFHPGNPVWFHPEIHWIWPVKSGGFHPDLTCEIHPKL